MPRENVSLMEMYYQGDGSDEIYGDSPVRKKRVKKKKPASTNGLGTIFPSTEELRAAESRNTGVSTVASRNDLSPTPVTTGLGADYFTTPKGTPFEDSSVDDYQSSLRGYEGENRDDQGHIPYWDEKGFTAGYGHQLTPADYEKFNIDPEDDDSIRGLRVTDQQASEWFEQDSTQARDTATQLLQDRDIKPTEELTNIVGQMVYQMGAEGAAGFGNMFEKIKTGDMEGAASEMLLNDDGTATPWAQQTKRRATDLSGRLASLQTS